MSDWGDYKRNKNRNIKKEEEIPKEEIEIPKKV